MVQEPKNNEINTKLPPKMLMRKPSSRQKSITRGTASSLAKSVHAQPQQPEERKRRPCTIRKKQDNNKKPYKFPLTKTTMNDDDASTTAGLGSFSDDSPDISADESITSRRLSDSSTLVDSLFDHHHHHHCHEEDNIPSYMRRPICAACNRNVKVNSESKQSTDSSRRSSLSSLKSDHLKRRYEHSPSTSPIPTRRSQKWSEILIQQHQLISMISDEDHDIQSSITQLNQYHHQQQQDYETILIETQAKILQKLTSMMVQQQQQQPPPKSKFGRLSQWLMGDDSDIVDYDYVPEEEIQNLVDILERPW